MTEDKKHAVTIELERYQKDGANMLIPSMDMSGLSEMHVPVVEKVFLNPNPQTGCDVYKQGDGFLLTGSALSKLSVCAGVVWDAKEVRRTDNTMNPLYISFQAVGGIKKIDGNVAYEIGNYDIDFIVEEEDLIEQYTKKASKPYKGKIRDINEQKTYVDFCVKRDLLFRKKHKTAICESGAKNRVLRKILCLKTSYTLDELQKPFVVVRVAFQPDYNDPAIKQQLIAASIQATTGVFGNPINQLPPPKPENVIDTTSEDLPPEEPEAQPGMSKEDIAGVKFDEFKNADPHSQIAMLKEMIKNKAYPIETKLHEGQTVETLTVDRMIELYSVLVKLKDSDIPF